MILSGALKPGDPINEKALADRNGLSRGPIREACRRLEQAGLVEIIVNRGAFVREISPRAARELCAVRMVLARYIGEQAATQITEPQLKQLRDLEERMEAEAKTKNLGAYSSLNAEFHKIILRAAGNQRLIDIYDGINKELRLFRWRALTVAPELGEALGAHRSILACLEARDPQRLAEAMEEHTRIANERLLEAGLSSSA